MSTIGSPIETSLLQTAQAQQSASKARDRAQAATDRARRARDLVDLSVAGVETADAVKKVPQEGSEQANSEHDSRDQAGGERPSLDLTA